MDETVPVNSSSSSNNFIFYFLVAIVLIGVVILALFYFNVLPFKNSDKNKTSTGQESSGRRYIETSSKTSFIGRGDKEGIDNYKKEDYDIRLGSFSKWEEIPGSKDMYGYFVNPKGEETFKVRIKRDPTPFDASDTEKNPNYTRLSVLNVNKSEESTFYKNFSDLTLDELNKIILKGDLAYVFTVQIVKSGKIIMVRDSNNVPYIINVNLRRFNGIEQLEKELK